MALHMASHSWLQTRHFQVRFWLDIFIVTFAGTSLLGEYMTLRSLRLSIVDGSAMV